MYSSGKNELFNDGLISTKFQFTSNLTEADQCTWQCTALLAIATSVLMNDIVSTQTSLYHTQGTSQPESQVSTTHNRN